MGRSDSKIKRNWIKNYDTWLHITWKNEYGFDCTNRFYFQSEDEAASWLEPLSRYATRAKALESSSSTPPTERLIQSAAARVRIEESRIQDETGETTTNAFDSTSSSFSTLPELRASPPASPRKTNPSPERSTTIASPQAACSPSPTRKRSRRSNSVGTDEGRKWSELVPRMLRRDSTNPSDKVDLVATASEPPFQRLDIQDYNDDVRFSPSMQVGLSVNRY